jgi:hypothetical protein
MKYDATEIVVIIELPAAVASRHRDLAARAGAAHRA